MVSYCCVKGCSNNSSKKKDSNTVVSFHAFPSNIDLKLKWLKAIGRPNWDPPNYVRICSAHFSHNYITHDGVRTRIMENACPDIALPPNSNFEASDVEVCRICLATDLRLHCLEYGFLKTSMESIIGFNENSIIEGLPKFLCYECATLVNKCHILVEKSMVSQATLLDIFALNGKITKALIKSRNRKRLNLNSSLQSHNATPGTVFEFQFDEAQNVSHPIGADLKIEQEINIENFNNIDNNLEEFDALNSCKSEQDFSNSDDEIYSHIERNKCYVIDEHDDNAMQINGDDQNFKNCDHSDLSYKDIIKNEEKIGKASEDCTQKLNPTKTRGRANRNIKEVIPIDTKPTNFSEDEIKLEDYFDVIKLTLQEQIVEWENSLIVREGNETKYTCTVCSKSFVYLKTYQNHITCHDASRGNVVCPVCKQRFRNDKQATAHAKYFHSKKYSCKLCLKTFLSISPSTKHAKWHKGYQYKCPHCTYSTVHVTSMNTHVRLLHSHSHICSLCGRSFISRKGLRRHLTVAHKDNLEPEENQQFRCELCDIGFASEGARRVHILTSVRHKKKPSLLEYRQSDPDLNNVCKSCGDQFVSHSKLRAHLCSEKAKNHKVIQKRFHWSLPGDSYPTKCNHCEEILQNRRQHYTHILRIHPKEKGSYKPVHTVICETCGKGFQNTTKLQLHELRHSGPPSVRCDLCSKMFYDKFRLAQHMVMHTETEPYRCGTCGRAFNRRSNLHRHQKVHSDIALYECSLCGKKFKYTTSMNLHVRTVHYKIPQPPRKRKRQKNYDNSD